MSLQLEDYKWTLRAQCRHCGASSTLVITMTQSSAFEVAAQYLRRLNLHEEGCQVAGGGETSSDASTGTTGGKGV